MELVSVNGGDLSPEQLFHMEKKKTEAEARLLAKKLGAIAIGASWMQALRSEFRKNYMDKVIIFTSIFCCGLKNRVFWLVGCFCC